MLKFIGKIAVGTAKGADHVTRTSAIVGGGAKHIARAGEPGAQLIGAQIRGMFRPETCEPLKTDSTDPAERFQVAMHKHGRTESDLAILVARSGRMAWLLVLLIVGLTAYGLFSGPVETLHPVLDAISAFLPFALHPLLLAVLFRTAFENYQLRTRQLVSVAAFTRQPGEWLPALRMPGKALLGVGVALLASGVASDAMADESVIAKLMEIPPTDLFLRTLGTFLGGIGPIPELPGNPSPWVLPIGIAFGVFNATLLAVGGSMLAWHTLAGIVSTAQEGELLGKKWSTIWAPVRVTMGIGLLVPAKAWSGFSAIQIVVLQIALASGGFANMIWTSFTETFTSHAYVSGAIENRKDRKADHAAAVFALERDSDGRNLILGMFEKNVCLNAMRASTDIYVSSYNIKQSGEIDAPLKDLAFITPDQLSAITFESRSVKNALAQGGLRTTGEVTDITPQLDLAEVATGSVTHNIGLARAGRITNEDPVNWPDALEPRAGFFPWSENTIEAKPVTYWNYGPVCGQVQLSFADLNLVKEYLVANQNNDTRIAAATAAIAGANYYAGRYIDQHVMQPLRTAADTWSAPITDPDRILKQAGVDPATVSGQQAQLIFDAYYKRINARDGDVTELIGTAYSNYLKVIEGTRAKLAFLQDKASPDDAQDTLVKTAQELGWSSSGAYYISLVRMAGHAIETTQIDAEVSDPDYNVVQSTRMRDEVRDIWVSVVAELEKFRTTALSQTYLTSDKDAAANAVVTVNDEIGIDSAWDFVQDKMNSVVRNALHPLLIDSLKLDPYTGLIDLIDQGHLYIQVAMVIVAVAFALLISRAFVDGVGEAASSIDTPLIGDLAAFLAGGSEIVSQGLGLLASMLKAIGFVVGFIGLMYAYILPLLPAIYSFYVVMGILVLICEALIAAPLWMLWHIRMDGSELVNEPQKAGYMIAFNLFVRAPIAVLAIGLSLAVMAGSLYLLSEIYDLLVVANVTDTQGFAWLGVFVMMLVLGYLNYQVVQRSCELIVELPDRVLRWLGSAAENLHEGDSTKALAAFMMQQTENRTQQITPSGDKLKATQKNNPKGDPKEKDKGAE